MATAPIRQVVPINRVCIPISAGCLPINRLVLAARLKRLLKSPCAVHERRPARAFCPGIRTRKIIAALAARLPPGSQTDVFSTL